MKKKIPLNDAAAIIVQAIFKQADKRWEELWPNLVSISEASELVPGKKEYVKFNFTLAALAVNMRTAFDVYPQPLAEALFATTLKILEHFLGKGKEFSAVRNAIVKYIDAFNEGVLAIKDPIRHVSRLLYYKVGFRNTEQQIVDERFFAPEPQVVEYLNNSLTMFTGKWEAMDQRFELVGPGERTPGE